MPPENIKESNQLIILHLEEFLCGGDKYVRCRDAEQRYLAEHLTNGDTLCASVDEFPNIQMLARAHGWGVHLTMLNPNEPKSYEPQNKKESIPKLKPIQVSEKKKSEYIPPISEEKRFENWWKHDSKLPMIRSEERVARLAYLSGYEEAMKEVHERCPMEEFVLEEQNSELRFVVRFVEAALRRLKILVKY